MGQKSIIFLTILIITAVALAVIFVITLLISDNRSGSEKDDEVETSSTLTNVSDILATPIVFENLRVVVEADMAAWVTKDSFTLFVDRTNNLFTPSTTRQLWIIFDDDFKLPNESEVGNLALGNIKRVRVVGFSRILDRESVERALGNGLDDPKLFLDGNKIATEWNYGILLIGESVEIIE